MPGYNPTQLAYNVQNANATAILIGAQTVAYAQTVSHSFGFGAEGIYGVGTAKPQEIQQLKNAPTITVDAFALTTAGNAMVNNGQPLAYILANNEFSVCIVDGVTNAAKFTYVGCTCSDFNENISANRPITDNITFLAMDVLNAAGVSLLNGPNAISVG